MFYLVQLKNSVVEKRYALGWPTFGTFSNMHGPKVPTVDPSLENSSQPKKFVIKSFFHLPHRNFMLQKYPIFRSNGGGLKHPILFVSFSMS